MRRRARRGNLGNPSLGEDAFDSANPDVSALVVEYLSNLARRDVSLPPQITDACPYAWRRSPAGFRDVRRAEGKRDEPSAKAMTEEVNVAG